MSRSPPCARSMLPSALLDIPHHPTAPRTQKAKAKKGRPVTEHQSASQPAAGACPPTSISPNGQPAWAPTLIIITINVHITASLKSALVWPSPLGGSSFADAVRMRNPVTPDPRSPLSALRPPAHIAGERNRDSRYACGSENGNGAQYGL